VESKGSPRGRKRNGMGGCGLDSSGFGPVNIVTNLGFHKTIRIS
jgi:hypothetical protein